MKGIIVVGLLLVTLFSCSSNNTVQVSGRIDSGDTIVSIWVEDSVYTFPLDKDNFFSGKMQMKKGGYATLSYNSLNLYLTPGEDLEISVNALNFSGSLYFRGSLGGINNYLKEQEVAVFFDKDNYELGEDDFVAKMKRLISEKIQLLEAKNFDDSFTRLEKDRIRYSVAAQVAYYPIYRRANSDTNYRPGRIFKEFLSSFSLDNEALFGAKDYRAFLVNYVYLLGSKKGGTDQSFSGDIADYIISTVTNPTIKNFLLAEVVYRYIVENNGLNGAAHLLEVFRRECTDKSNMAYMEEVISHWEKLLPGRLAPDFTLTDEWGNPVSLVDFRGSYLYITVWATWCVPCKGELPYLNLLQKEYSNKNIKFLTVAIDKAIEREQWLEFLQHNHYAGMHTMADAAGKFNEKYMIISIPRFILIGPDGIIINSNAPRPSGQIRLLFDSLDI